MIKILAAGAAAFAMAVIVLFALRFGQRLLRATRIIDRISQASGVIASFLALFSCLISAGNAISRYSLNASSKAWLEIQWYMFAAMVLLGADETFRRNEHSASISSTI